MLLIGQNKHSKFTYITLEMYHRDVILWNISLITLEAGASSASRAKHQTFIKTLKKQQPKCNQLEKSWFWMHAFDWPADKHSKFTCTCNTLQILPVTMTCAVLCWQTYLEMYSSAFCHIWALRHLRRVTSAKGSQKSEYYMLAFDWIEQTDKIGCNTFPARMTCAELCFQTTCGHIPLLCAKLEP